MYRNARVSTPVVFHMAVKSKTGKWTMECSYERKLQSPEKSLILSHGVTNVNKAQNHNSGQGKRQKIILYIIFYLKKNRQKSIYWVRIRKSSLKKVPIGCVIYFLITRQLCTWGNTRSGVLTLREGICRHVSGVRHKILSVTWNIRQKSWTLSSLKLWAQRRIWKADLARALFDIPARLCPCLSSLSHPLLGNCPSTWLLSRQLSRFPVSSLLKVRSGIRYETDLHALHSPSDFHDGISAMRGISVHFVGSFNYLLKIALSNTTVLKHETKEIIDVDCKY